MLHKLHAFILSLLSSLSQSVPTNLWRLTQCTHSQWSWVELYWIPLSYNIRATVHQTMPLINGELFVEQDQERERIGVVVHFCHSLWIDSTFNAQYTHTHTLVSRKWFDYNIRNYINVEFRIDHCSRVLDSFQSFSNRDDESMGIVVFHTSKRFKLLHNLLISTHEGTRHIESLLRKQNFWCTRESSIRWNNTMSRRGGQSRQKHRRTELMSMESVGMTGRQLHFAFWIKFDANWTNSCGIIFRQTIYLIVKLLVIIIVVVVVVTTTILSVEMNCSQCELQLNLHEVRYHSRLFELWYFVPVYCVVHWYTHTVAKINNDYRGYRLLLIERNISICNELVCFVLHRIA